MTNKIRITPTANKIITRYQNRLAALENTPRTFINSEHIRQQIRTVQSFVRTLRELRDRYEAKIEKLQREISLLKLTEVVK